MFSLSQQTDLIQMKFLTQLDGLMNVNADYFFLMKVSGEGELDALFDKIRVIDSDRLRPIRV